MKIIDITMPLSASTPTWPGDEPVRIEKRSSMDAGAQDNVSRLACSVHAGTHVDAPHHFLNDHRTVEQLPLEILVGKATVAEIPGTVARVTENDLAELKLPPGTTRLLLKTRNSHPGYGHEASFRKDFVGITAAAADWLVEHGIQLIGIDYLSIAPFKESLPIHTNLLKAGIIILEGLDLCHVQAGDYDLFCLPLKLTGADGSPARVILTR
jgi:arylformamidase